MNLLDAALIFLAGIAAGSINAVVGSGSLITFPTLVALGFPPVVANVSNNIGLVPGAVAGAYGYRRELRGQLVRVLRLAGASLIGALIGAALLLVLPEGAFEVIVPVLIVIALLLVVLQPWLNAWLAARRRSSHPHGGPWLLLGIFGTGVYGGYFGAAQGVILLALLGIFLEDDLQRVNGVKNVLAGVANGAAAVLFIAVAPEIDWMAVLLIAVGSSLGGLVGALAGRRLPAVVLRTVIVAVGLLAVGKLIFG
ncbi:MAG TPA: sulfite exporter TauE/SafE family protein [Streptosporangiaceae bacterium]|nr:sulfite exporter TauE/SafE family protein [Streptosporangiaceae bacterium]